MGWSDDEDEDILVDLEAIDAGVAAAAATRARRSRADDEDENDDGRTVTEQLVDDEAGAEAEEVEDDSQAEEDGEERKSAVTAEEKEQTGNKAQSALLYMVHQMAAEVLSLVRDVVYDHVQSVGRDLELFAKHAKRTVVNLEDVMLGSGTRLTYRLTCDRLLAQQTTALEEFRHKHKIGVGKKRNKKRKKADEEQADGEKEEAEGSDDKRASRRAGTSSRRSKRATN